LGAISRIEQEKKRDKQQQANKGYWQNELDSLGIAPDQKKKLTSTNNLKTYLALSNRQCFGSIK
jgi:hypothetical protein